MSRLPKYKTQRDCQKCGEILEAGQRKCSCAKKKKWDSDRQYPKDLNSSSNYHLAKTFGKGFGLKNDFRAAHWGFIYEPKGERRSFVIQDNKAIAIFLWRAEMAYLKGDQFAGLLGRRIALRLQGKTDHEVCEWLDLSRRELVELDHIIVGGYLTRMPRSKFDGKIPAVERKMKKGVARDIIRQWKHRENYNRGQVLSPQLVSPFKR